jgi:hypothetical protein
MNAAQPTIERPRKKVGKALEELSVFERVERLQASLDAMGLKQKKDGEYIRRTVGIAPKK